MARLECYPFPSRSAGARSRQSESAKWRCTFNTIVITFRLFILLRQDIFASFELFKMAFSDGIHAVFLLSVVWWWIPVVKNNRVEFLLSRERYFTLLNRIACAEICSVAGRRSGGRSEASELYVRQMMFTGETAGDWLIENKHENIVSLRRRTLTKSAKQRARVQLWCFH